MKTIDNLRKECEDKFGRSLRSPSDFDAFHIALRETTKRAVSVSTLKRLWGYVNYSFKPSNEVLSILASYCGYKDWYSYKSSEQISDISDFLSRGVVKSEDLSAGTLLTLKWEPNRTCTIKYLGNSRYEVIESENSKLKEHDTFTTSILINGEPLVCRDILRIGESLAEAYVAGKTGGIRISVQTA